MNPVVLGLLLFLALLVGVGIGALATAHGYRHNPPREPGRHSRRPDGGPERRRDYQAGPMPKLGHRWPEEEPVTGPRTPSGAGSANRREEPRTDALGPVTVGTPWHEGMSQPETREMGAVRPSPGQDMERWRREEQERRGFDA